MKIPILTLKGDDGLMHEILAIRGAKGDRGDQGDKGDPGITPVRGIDYFTDTDKSEIVDAVLAELLNGDEVSY